MKKILLIFIVAISPIMFAASFNGEILCDPVNEMDSLILSKDAVVQPAFHYINGYPVQCLRVSLQSESSRTSLFVRIKAKNLTGKKINFICAVASANNNNNSAKFKLVANGVNLFNSAVKSEQPVYFRANPTVDNFGTVNFSFEISYYSPKKVFAVDLILPAVVGLGKTVNSVQKPDIKFGLTDSNKTWRIADSVNIKTSDFKVTDNIFLIPQLKLLKIISKSIEPRDGMPVKIIAILKNTGWKDYINSIDNTLKISVDKKSGVTDEDKQVQLIPNIAAGGLAEIEWTIHTHKNISKINGELISDFLNKNEKFNIPLYAIGNQNSKAKNKNGWKIFACKKENLIVYDWMQNNVNLRFIKSPCGIQNVQFSVRNNNKYKTVATIDNLAEFDAIAPNNKIKTLTFTPKSVRYLESENKVLVRGWAFDKEIGGLTVEQYYSRPNNTSEIKIETKITAKSNIRLVEIRNPVFNLETAKNSILIIPGFVFEKLVSPLKIKKYKWIIENSNIDLIQLSQQLIPFVYAESLGGSVCFKNPESSFRKNNSLWAVEKFFSKMGGRYTIVNITKPSFGNILKNLKSKESLYTETYLEIIPEKTVIADKLPNILQLGVIPVQLIDAEKKRLVKKFITSINEMSALSPDEIDKLIVLLRASKSKDLDAETNGKINDLYSKLLAGLDENKNEKNKKRLLKLCTKYDWTLDKKISGNVIINRMGIYNITDDLLELLNNNNKNNKEAISLALSLLQKIRGKLIFPDDLPALSIYAKLAKANIAVYKSSGDKSFLYEANRLLHLGEIFMRKSTENIARGIGMAEENVGNTSPGNYVGLFSADATLRLVDALYDAAEADALNAERNYRLANLILDAVEKFYLRENKDGLIPEYLVPEFNTVTGKYLHPYLLWKMFLRQNKLLK